MDVNESSRDVQPYKTFPSVGGIDVSIGTLSADCHNQCLRQDGSVSVKSIQHYLLIVMSIFSGCSLNRSDNTIASMVLPIIDCANGLSSIAVPFTLMAIFLLSGILSTSPYWPVTRYPTIQEPSDTAIAVRRNASERRVIRPSHAAACRRVMR